jgi:hypothetical protein
MLVPYWRLTNATDLHVFQNGTSLFHREANSVEFLRPAPSPETKEAITLSIVQETNPDAFQLLGPRPNASADDHSGKEGNNCKSENHISLLCICLDKRS